MLLQIGWAMLGIEFLMAAVFGYILWFVWSRSAMPRSTARAALFVYMIGSAACLLFSAFLPL
jgi:hypothetical protein